jgi:putative Holliday junction resolvase
MPIIAVPDLMTLLPRGQRLLGIDLGKRRIGLALSDASLTIASPCELLERTRLAHDLDRILAAVDRQGVGGIVLGLPVQMDGAEGARAQAARQFARDLLQRRDLPLALWDERLSTAAVERMLITEADLSRARRRQVIDKTAAAYILQGALDALAHVRHRPI